MKYSIFIAKKDTVYNKFEEKKISLVDFEHEHVRVHISKYFTFFDIFLVNEKKKS